MDIRIQLLKEHSRANAEAVAAFVGDDAARFSQLMHCMLGDDARTAQRAAFSVGIVGERHAVLLLPYLKSMLKSLERPVHPAIPRNVIRLFQTCELPKALHGRITEAMFARIAEPKHPIAERAFAITVAERLVKLYPELADEFRLLLEDVLRVDPGPAIRSRALKVLRALGQRNASARGTGPRAPASAP